MKNQYVPKKENAEARYHLKVLQDMCIKLSEDEVKYLFSLQSEYAIENYCPRIIMERL